MEHKYKTSMMFFLIELIDRKLPVLHNDVTKGSHLLRNSLRLEQMTSLIAKELVKYIKTSNMQKMTLMRFFIIFLRFK